jgi:hypothetical protein
MHAPFVFAAQPRRRAVDHDLALAQGEGALIQQASGEHLAEDAGIARHGAEQDQRLHSGRHDAGEGVGNGGCVGRDGRFDAVHATVYAAAPD